MDLNSSPQLPKKVYAEVVVRSKTGESILDTNATVTSRNIINFYANSNIQQIATQRLRASGFEILDIGHLSISIAAAPEIYQQAFNSPLEAVERPVIKELGLQTTAAFLNAIDDAPFGQISPNKSDFQDILSGIVLNEPLYYLQSNYLQSDYLQSDCPSVAPPPTSEPYLSVPDDLAKNLNATALHQRGITGKGVHVVMVDSGWYRHPFFEKHNYNVDVALAPGSCDVSRDESGHGTGESANLLAIAPGVSLTIVKADIAIASKMRNVNSIAALRAAAALKPDIISCSWGSDQRNPTLSPYNRLLAATVADLTRQNIIVIFAAGNGQWGFPAQHPEVIAAGGTYLHLTGSLRGTLEASNYASSFLSPVYQGRAIPDVCGLVGRLPHGKYILLPIPPGCGIDRTLAIVQDGTKPIDGWAAFSGTSAAAPQLAGVCALMKQVNPRLSPAQAKRILQQTARDVINGTGHPNTDRAAARAGPDLATGYGLVDAEAAVRAIEQDKPPNNCNQDTSFQAINFHTSSTFQIFQEQPTMASQFPKLEKQLDELLWKFEKDLQKLVKEQGLEDVELSIGIDAFIERSPLSKVAYSLRQSLDECFAVNDQDQPTSVVDASKITKKHISAAQGLIKIGRYQKTSVEVLTQALDSSKSAIKKLASQALSDCSSEIARFDVSSRNSMSFYSDGDCYCIGENGKEKCYVTINGIKIPVDRCP